MDSKSMTRKDFVLLTFTLIGGGALGSACSSDNNGGTGGNSGGSGGGGGSGVGGGSGSGGSGGAAACTDPLLETELTNTGHIHTLVVAASLLNQTTSQIITTGSAMDPGGTAHTHMVTIVPEQLATLKGGGMVTAASTVALTGGAAHAHDFMVKCH